MPSDLPSALVLILLRSADALGRLWPYIAGGLLATLLLSRLVRDRPWAVPAWWPRPLVTPVAAMLGAASPLPTLSMVPAAMRFGGEGPGGGPVLAFVLASLLMNPQLFLLTLGAFGLRFALAQVGAVLLISTLLGLVLGPARSAAGGLVLRLRPGTRPEGHSPQGSQEPGSGQFHLQPIALVRHLLFTVLVGVVAGAALQLLLPQLGVPGWLGERGLLSTPMLAWLGAPFYGCGGSAVPLAGSLAQSGFSRGSLFAFLLIGPALRGTALASLGSLLPRKALVACLVILALSGGLLGLGLDWLAEAA